MPTPREIAEKLYFDRNYLPDLALKQLSEWIRSYTKNADSFVKDGRDRLLATGYNQALSDVIALIDGR